MEKRSKSLKRAHQNRVVGSLVRIKHGPDNFGFGFLANDPYILTAAHCLPRIPEPLGETALVEVHSLDGQSMVRAAVVFVDPCSDLASYRGAIMGLPISLAS